MALLLFLAFSLLLQGAFGELVCEELPVGMCSFAISSTGKRCLLETYASNVGPTKFQCKTSEVMVNNNMREYIETDHCINACGLDRKAVGISSDILLDPRFAAKICSPDCSNRCPNILDLHQDLALVEGMLLSELCRALRNSPRRAMSQLVSSSASGPVVSSEPWGPASVESSALAPAPFN
ncbi:hypothetical protein ACH5RR_010153 [Cinchona calisaya]|uniref:PAR1 protein n=1 Tax=Cinchona calisaya TaxID=153742 RepID=A0ABD3AHT2_9GENT